MSTIDQHREMSTITKSPLLTQSSARRMRRGAKKEWVLYIIVLIASDLLSTFAAFRLAYWLRFNSGLPIFLEDGLRTAPFYDSIMIGVIPVWLIIFGVMGLYSRQTLLGGVREYAALFNAATLGMLLIITARFTFPESLILARGWTFSAWVLTFFIAGITRFILRRGVYTLRSRGYFRSNAIIVGYNEEGRLMAEQIHQNPRSSMKLVGYIPSEPGQCSDCAVPNLNNLGSIETLGEIIDNRRIERIVLANSALSREQILTLYRQFGNLPGVDLVMSSGLYEMLTTGMYIQEDGSVPLVAINKIRMTGVDQLLKNTLDYVLAIAGIIALSPVLLAVALWVKLDSPGPVIYRRRVMGVNGKQFDAYKFRTMDTRSEDILRSDPKLLKEYLENFKIKDDPRITRSGRLLRKTSIDELPQLFNILRGQMSLVGPRMITPEELGKYSQWDLNLLTVKPGLTGLWQVRGRSDVSYEERVRLDMYYIRNWTIWLDVQLIFQTIPAVLKKRGAY